MPGFATRTACVFLLLASCGARAADTGNNFSGTRSAELSALGDRLFRDARFEDAEAAYSQALDFDPQNLSAHLGMGKIADLLSQPRRAAGQYAAAYRIAPHNPESILAFAGVVEDSEARQTLFRNFLAFARDARVEDVRARLHIEKRIAREALSTLTSPSQPYRIPLSPVRTSGMAVRARINGGRDLKLILDTGATGIVLNKSAGSETDLEILTAAALSGYGSSAPSAAHKALATSLETGALKIANLLLVVSETDLAKDADGMIGLDVFRNFLVRLDLPEQTLELTPFVDPPAASCSGCLRAYRLEHMLLVQGTVNGHADGYFILDSGSPFTMISRKLMCEEGSPATFTGAQGSQAVLLPRGPVNIRLGNWRLTESDYATFDSSEISSRYGTEIAGAIGFSVLRDMSLTVDYRSGMVKLAKSVRR